MFQHNTYKVYLGKKDSVIKRWKGLQLSEGDDALSRIVIFAIRYYIDKSTFLNLGCVSPVSISPADEKQKYLHIYLAPNDSDVRQWIEQNASDGNQVNRLIRYILNGCIEVTNDSNGEYIRRAHEIFQESTQRFENISNKVETIDRPLILHSTQSTNAIDEKEQHNEKAPIKESVESKDELDMLYSQFRSSGSFTLPD